MSNINLRLYGEQIYPNISKYLSKYISPEIKKDEFISMYKNGSIELNEISLKEAFSINPQIKIDKSFISSIKINIPDEKDNFGISINDIKCQITISDITESEVEKLLIEEKKNLISEFIDFSVKKIQKKDGPSFLDNLIKSVIEKIINGFVIDIKNFELKIKTDKADNVFLTFIIEDMNFSIDKGIKINNINILYLEEQIKINIIEKFNINIDFIYSNEKDEPNKIKININNININLNKKVFNKISDILNIFDEANYTKIYTKYKKLILYYKPKMIENGKKEYITLWRFAIRAIIKLQKYIRYKKYNVFNLTNFNQIKIVENYLKNKEAEDKILLSEDNNILKATKNEVEKKVLNDKNSNVLASAFSFFFGAKKEEKKNELTEEEKKIMDDIYNDENIFKYLNHEIENASSSFNIIYEKIKSFFSNISINFDFSGLQFNLRNENEIYDFNCFMNSLKCDLNYIEKTIDFNLFIDDIGLKDNTSLFLKKNGQHSIKISRDKDGFIELKLGFEKIQINIEEFKGIFIFLNSIKTKKKQKIFYNNLNLTKAEKKEDIQNKIKNNILNFSFVNNFKISNIPSLSILMKDNYLDINIFDYFLEDNSIKFHINVSDSFSKIINDLFLKIDIKDNSLNIPIDSPLEINLKKEFLSNVLMNYSEYTKEIVKDNNNQQNFENNDKLFVFDEIVNTKNNFEMFDISEYSLNFIIKEIKINMYKDKSVLENSFYVDNIQLLYDKTNFNFNFNKLILLTDFKSDIFSYILNSEKEPVKKDKSNIKQEQIKSTKLNNNISIDVLNKFNCSGKNINIVINSDKLSLSISLNNINIYKTDDNKDIYLFIDFLDISQSNNKNNIIIKSDKKSSLKYEIFSNFLKAEMDSTYSNVDLQFLKESFNELSFLFKTNNENDNISLKKNEFYKFEFNITNFHYELLNKYNMNVSKMNISNAKNEKDNISPIYYFKLEELEVNNINKNNILNSKQLNINYNFSSEKGYIINFNCNEIFLNLSKNDFSFLTSGLKSNNNKKQNLVNSVIVGNNRVFKNILSLNEKEFPDKIKDINIYNSKNIVKIISKESEKNSVRLNICFDKLDLSFCKNNNYEKIIQLSMNRLNINSIIKEIFISKDFNCNLTVGNLDFIYYDDINSEKVNILSKRKKEIIENQIEFKYSNNNSVTNLNNNEINLRIDSFLTIYYYFVGNESFKKTYKTINEIFDVKKSFKISVVDSKFKLNTSFKGKEDLFLDINNFTINYDNTKCIFPYGIYDLFLDKVSSDIISKNQTRKLFKTGENFNKIKINYYEKFTSLNISFGNLIINLSYRDLVSFLRAYEINLKLIDSSMININSNSNDFEKEIEKEIKRKENEKFLQQKEKSNEIKTVFTGELSLKNINITLIDNSKGSYQPFLNFIFENLNLNFLPDSSYNSKFAFRFSTYNYIACLWEPVIEKILFKSDGIYRGNYEIKLGTDKLLMNLSDMAISFTLIIFNNWLTQLDIKTKKFKEKKIKFNKLESKKEFEKIKKSTKITNNQLINYTGMKLTLIHNDKSIECSPLQKIELDNSNLEENEDIKKSQNISIIYDKNHNFQIPLGKIITLFHQINDKLFIISENSLSENKTINITLYSPFIFQNKTPFILKIEITNRMFGGKEIIILNPNSICGLPIESILSNTNICFFLEESNQYSDKNKTDIFNIGDILNSKKFKKKIFFSDKSYTMELFTKFKKIRMLVIYSEFNIINCLPCYIMVDYLNKRNIIEKCTQYYISENYIKNLFVQFTINTEMGSFTSDKIDLLKLNSQLTTKNISIKQFITFKNNDLGKKFDLNFIFKQIEEAKVFIIYSELILYNRSGLNLSINDENKNHYICFNVDDKINLISSNVNYKEEKVKFRCTNFSSNDIKIHELIQITNNKSISMFDMQLKKPFDIIIKKKLSYIKIKNNPNFGENIISVIFSVFPMCRIFNLLSGKQILISDDKDINKRTSILIKPFEIVNFKFFNKGYDNILNISALNLEENNSKELSKIRFQIGIYTLVTNDFFYNLDIKKNPTAGCLDVYILENNINNTQTILENFSDEEITLYQINYEQYQQALNPKEITPLRIYDYTNKKFVVLVNNAFQEINIGDIKKQKTIHLTNKVSAIIQDNGIKTKITFYPKIDYDLTNSSVINIKSNIYIKDIYISVIGDNEIQDPKLANYERFELVLITLNNFELNINIQQTIGLLKKNSIITKLVFDKINIYNQLSSEGKFANILRNKEIPCFSMENDISYYNEQKVINFNKQKIEIKKLKLGIDPDYISKLLTFYDNVLSRMDLTYFNVNKLFLDKQENKSKKLINKHIKGRILINANNLLFPKLDIEFKLVEKGLKELLKERIACSDFYIWVAKGLVGQSQNLSIKNSLSSYTNGTIVQYYVWIYYKYLNDIQEKVSEIGFKGIVGHLSNFAKLDLLFDDIKKDKNFKKNRLREPRPFYGKFKYYKEYDENDIKLIKLAILNNKKNQDNKQYPIKIIKGEYSLFLFTNFSIFHFEPKKLSLNWKINYDIINKATNYNNDVKVYFKNKIDSGRIECLTCKCENNDIATEISRTINEETLKFKESVNEL